MVCSSTVGALAHLLAIRKNQGNGTVEKTEDLRPPAGSHLMDKEIDVRSAPAVIVRLLGFLGTVVRAGGS
jgi:hypothetical protein